MEGVVSEDALMNLGLASCRSPFLDDDKIYVPLGNLYLKSYLAKHAPNVTVTILDDNYDSNNPATLTGFDAVGISIMTPQRVEATKILHAIKTHHPAIKVIAGGPHCRYYTAEAEAEPYDHIVVLDGEKSLTSIVQGNASRVIRDVMSVKDILEAPRPDRTSPDAIHALRSYKYTLRGKPATTMMTARGCPEKCTFCEEAMTMTKWSSLSNLEAEMQDIKNLGYQGVYIFDDLFAIAMPKVKPICALLLQKELIYRCNGQVKYFTKWGNEFAKMLASTGCVEMAFGFESGSQEILDRVLKRTTVAQNYDAVTYAKKEGIHVKGFVMIGLPGETRETIRETEKFIATSGMDDFQLSIYYPYKGTQIRDAIDKGEGAVDLMFLGEGLGAYGQKGGSTESVVRTSTLSSEKLLEERDRLVRTYKPKAHAKKWEKNEDRFFDQHLGVEA